MKFYSFEEYKLMNESVKYHIDNDLSITESIYRIGSDAYCDFVNEVRKLNAEGKIQLSDVDKFIVERLKTGTKAVYKPRGGNEKEVVLDSPERGGRKKFFVYRDSGRKNADGKIIAKIIEWGDPKLTVKNDDEKAAKSFRARHRCTEKTDKDTAGWWACNVHKFWKQLGLKSDNPW